MFFIFFFYSIIMDNVITQAYYNPSLLKKLIVGDEFKTKKYFI